MPIKKSDLDRKIQIFKDYLETGNASEVGRKHDISGQSVARHISSLGRNIRNAYRVDGLDDSLAKIPETLDNKEAWYKNIDYYVVYINRLENVQDDSPVRDININGLRVSLLKKHDINTVGDLLAAMKDRREFLVELFGGIITSVRVFEIKLKEKGFDPYGGRNQKAKQD